MSASKRIGAPLLALSLLLPAAAAAAAAGQAGQARSVLPYEIRRVSVASDGSEGNDTTRDPSLSDDGRMVVFTSHASNLVPNDNNDGEDVFVHDRLTSETRLVSVNSDGVQGNGRSFSGSISPDGRYVVFYSFSTNLVPGIGGSQVYRHDLETGRTEHVSVAAAGGRPDGPSTTIGSTRAVSQGGRYVVYSSTATDIVPGTRPPASGNHIYLRDMEAGTNELISIAQDGEPGTQSSQTPTITSDGNRVVFETRSPLDPRDTNSVMDVYVRDRSAGFTEWVSTNNRWEPGFDTSWRGRPNEDGSIIAFDSSATNFTPLDQGSLTPDVYVRDLTTKRTQKVAISSAGLAPNDVAYRGWPDASGRFLSFWSAASNLVPGNNEGAGGDVFIHDRLLGLTTRHSLAHDGSFGSATSQLPALSGDARGLTFMSFANNLVPDDTNDRQDAFARQVSLGLGFVEALRGELSGDTLSLEARVAATGQRLASATDAEGDLLATPASEVAGDIIGADLAYRADAAEELSFRTYLKDMPIVPIVGATEPGVTYGVEFSVGEVGYEVRLTAGGTPRHTIPQFMLSRCAPACVPVKEVPGSVGTAGEEAHFTVSLADIGAEPGSAITNTTAFVAAGAGVGPDARLDEVSLPTGHIPQTTVSMGHAPASAGAEDVSFTGVDVTNDGRMSVDLPVADLAPGSYRAWARVCMDDHCSLSSVPFEVGGEVTPPTAGTEVEVVLNEVKNKVVATAILRDADGVRLAGQRLTFFLDAQNAGAAVTDAEGVATKSFSHNRLREGAVLTVRFAGTDDYEPSEVRTSLSR